MPLAYLVERPDEVSANWRIGTPSPCDNGCDGLIAEIAAAQWPVVDLYDPTAVPVKETSPSATPVEASAKVEVVPILEPGVAG